mgnify:FL=1
MVLCQVRNDCSSDIMKRSVTIQEVYRHKRFFITVVALPRDITTLSLLTDAVNSSSVDVFSLEDKNAIVGRIKLLQSGVQVKKPKLCTNRFKICQIIKLLIELYLDA